jgi:hypothetical protein
MSSLAVIALEDILLHEDHDATRAMPLVHAIARDGRQQHPVVVARDQAGPLIHLDGANRITALRHLGCRHIVAQMLDYANPAAVRLDTWVHLEGIEPAALRAAARAWRTASLEELSPAQATTLLTQEQVVAVVVFDHGEILAVRSGMGLAARVAALQQLTTVYTTPPLRETGPDVDLVAGLQGLLARTPEVNAGIAFAPLRKADVITLVCNLRLRLPAGITRHVVTCGRILHVNAPLALLQADCSAAEKTAQLQALLAGQRRRLYAEPTIQFEAY